MTMHLVYNNKLLVVVVHEIGGGSKVKTEDLNSQKFEVVIVYEAHHYPAHMWRTVVHVDHFREPCVCVLFLTATPAPAIANPNPYLGHVTS